MVVAATLIYEDNSSPHQLQNHPRQQSLTHHQSPQNESLPQKQTTQQNLLHNLPQHHRIHDPSTPATLTQWWLARENAFDTASRVYKKLYRPDSDTSYYSREQDYDEDDDEEGLLSPSSPEWNASRWFWSVERSEMWVEHVASSGWSADTKAMGVIDPEAPSDTDGQTCSAPGNSKHKREESEDSQRSKAEVKSIAVEPSRRPKLTIQIPCGTPGYYANHGPNYSSCRPHITSEERAEWKKNMF
jgi:hypothetical protein